MRAAFTPWSRQETLVLPGPGGGWRARRRPARPGAFWALSTSGVLAGHGFTLGLRSPADRAPAAFAVEIADPAAGTAFLARLVVRDPGRAPQPYLAPGGEPPAGAERVVAASDRRALDGGRAWRFTFPAGAADALAALDPRENARLELVYPGASGDRIVSALVPVGDFAVGRAFLDAGR